MKATDIITDSSDGEGKEKKNEEKISPYDWEAFGFKVCKEEMDRYFLSKSSLMKFILKYIDENGDGTLTEKEFSRYENNPHIRNLLSKLICVHRSEWAYSGDALSTLKNEVEEYYNEQVKLLNTHGNEKQEEVEEKRKEDLSRFESKVKSLTFLDQIPLDVKSSLPAGCFYYFHPIAFVEQMKRMNVLPVIFPLRVKPLNDKGSKIYPNCYWADKSTVPWAVYGSNRSKGRRKHAGRDLYGKANETEIVAICEGVVLSNNHFYNSTNEIAILHTTSDGRKFIARYGEVSPNSVTVKKHDKVEQGQVIAKVGALNPSVSILGKVTNMLHFELYTGSEGFDLKKTLTDKSGDSKYQRRADLVDPLSILEEGYNNTFHD